ncbi:MAG: galactose-phosphate uridylyltransferase [Gemmatimonadetes bacterium]|nr:galactose-phosphate uridylyltransferase [Gemmatimonadota bacterium]
MLTTTTPPVDLSWTAAAPPVYRSRGGEPLPDGAGASEVASEDGRGDSDVSQPVASVGSAKPIDPSDETAQSVDATSERNEPASSVDLSRSAISSASASADGDAAARGRTDDAVPATAPAARGAADEMLREQPHRRLNPLTGEWVLVSPHRAKRPWQGRVEPLAPVHRPAHDPTCYLCPGNERAGGERNPEYTGTFVFDNDFAALRPGSPDGAAADVDVDGLLVARAETGICRVICFSPRHDLSLPDMEPAAIRGVVDVWAEEYARLGSRPDIGHVQVFENKGEAMGCSNPHPHGQIWAQASVPLIAARETARMEAHHARHRRTLLSDYLRLELAAGERIVLANDGFVALVPFWAVWPFETLVVSRRPVPSLAELGDAGRDALADVVKRLTVRYDHLFGISFPYSAGLHQAPTDGRPHPEWHLHMHFLPPLLRSATVRKFMVGYEMLGEPQRDATPESAAERLRALPDVRAAGGAA